MHCQQLIYKNDGNFEEATDLVSETLNGIRTACKTDSVLALETILKSLQPDRLGHYLNALIQDDQLSAHTYLTPLMIASASGHDSIVRFILENYSEFCLVDAQDTSSHNVKHDHCSRSECFHKQTALWFAVQSKHLNIVQTLISLGQANVNHKVDYDYSDSNWTPLHLACDTEQLEMVKCLIKNGADLYHVDKYDSTALMIASNRGYDDIVQYLLDLDDGSNHLLNAVNNNGSTALHEAAYLGRLNTVKLLLEEHHAKIVKDNDGYTPLTMAGIGNEEEVVKYFVENEKQSYYTIFELIDELELIGSYHLKMICQPEDVKRAYGYLVWSMKLRYKDPQEPIFKTDLISPMDGYSYFTECETVEDLQLIVRTKDINRLIYQCLMIHERRGVTEDFLKLLDYQDIFFRHELYKFTYYNFLHAYEQWQYSFQRWLHAYYLRRQTQIDVEQCAFLLEKCTRIMCDLIVRKKTKEIRFDMLMEILQETENEYLRNKNLVSKLHIERGSGSHFDSLNEIELINGDKCLYVILNLLFVALKVSKKKEYLSVPLQIVFSLFYD